MGEKLHPEAATPKVVGPVYVAAAGLAGGKEANWKTLGDRTYALVAALSRLRGFPCDTKRFLAQSTVAALGLADEQAELIWGKRYCGTKLLLKVAKAHVVSHGHLEVRQGINQSIVIVTGDLCVLHGNITDSVVLVQGDVTVYGMIRNSIVMAGSDREIRVIYGYPYDALTVSGLLDCSRPYRSSSASARIRRPRPTRPDIRDGRLVNPKIVYMRMSR